MRTSGWNIILLEMKLPQKTSAPPIMPITGQAPVVLDKLGEKVTATLCQGEERGARKRATLRRENEKDILQATERPISSEQENYCARKNVGDWKREEMYGDR